MNCLTKLFLVNKFLNGKNVLNIGRSVTEKYLLNIIFLNL